jgi:DNA-3-methyladenine glycosylase
VGREGRGGRTGSTEAVGSEAGTGERNTLPWAWRAPPFGGVRRPLPSVFFQRDAEVVARKLLGTCLRSLLGQQVKEAVVVEAEAYVGPHDPASHASARIGRTRRNETMFGPPGCAYVYRSYGIHWCLNVVTGEPGFPAAVLIRALDPVRGEDDMLRNRSGRRPLCSGPGRLTQALGITGELDGHPLHRPPLQLLRGWPVPDELVAVSGRIGIREAATWPLRFYLRGHPEVSRGPRVQLW